MKRLEGDILNCLSSFEKVREWQDLASCLQRLQKLVMKSDTATHSPVPCLLPLSRRLAQCLLKQTACSGAYTYALAVYKAIFLRVGSDGIPKCLPFLLPGLHAFYPEAATFVRQNYFDLFETCITPHLEALKECRLELISCLVTSGEVDDPKLQEYIRFEAYMNEWERVLKPFQLEQSLWEIAAKFPSRRLGALKTLYRRREHTADLWAEHKHVSALQVESMVACLVSAPVDLDVPGPHLSRGEATTGGQSAVDSDLMSKRLVLDVLIHQLPLSSDLVDQRQKLQLVSNVIPLVTLSDSSIRSRVDKWLFEGDLTSTRGDRQETWTHAPLVSRVLIEAIADLTHTTQSSVFCKWAQRNSGESHTGVSVLIQCLEYLYVEAESASLIRTATFSQIGGPLIALLRLTHTGDTHVDVLDTARVIIHQVGIEGVSILTTSLNGMFNNDPVKILCVLLDATYLFNTLLNRILFCEREEGSVDGDEETTGYVLTVILKATSFAIESSPYLFNEELVSVWVNMVDGLIDTIDKVKEKCSVKIDPLNNSYDEIMNDFRCVINTRLPHDARFVTRLCELKECVDKFIGVTDYTTNTSGWSVLDKLLDVSLCVKERIYLMILCLTLVQDIDILPDQIANGFVDLFFSTQNWNEEILSLMKTVWSKMRHSKMAIILLNEWWSKFTHTHTSDDRHTHTSGDRHTHTSEDHSHRSDLVIFSNIWQLFDRTDYCEILMTLTKQVTIDIVTHTCVDKSTDTPFHVTANSCTNSVGAIMYHLPSESQQKFWEYCFDHLILDPLQGMTVGVDIPLCQYRSSFSVQSLFNDVTILHTLIKSIHRRNLPKFELLLLPQNFLSRIVDLEEGVSISDTDTHSVSPLVYFKPVTFMDLFRSQLIRLSLATGRTEDEDGDSFQCACLDIFSDVTCSHELAEFRKPREMLCVYGELLLDAWRYHLQRGKVNLSRSFLNCYRRLASSGCAYDTKLPLVSDFTLYLLSLTSEMDSEPLVLVAHRIGSSVFELVSKRASSLPVNERVLLKLLDQVFTDLTHIDDALDLLAEFSCAELSAGQSAMIARTRAMAVLVGGCVNKCDDSYTLHSKLLDTLYCLIRHGYSISREKSVPVCDVVDAEIQYRKLVDICVHELVTPFRYLNAHFPEYEERKIEPSWNTVGILELVLTSNFFRPHNNLRSPREKLIELIWNESRESLFTSLHNAWAAVSMSNTDQTDHFVNFITTLKCFNIVIFWEETTNLIRRGDQEKLGDRGLLYSLRQTPMMQCLKLITEKYYQDHTCTISESDNLWKQFILMGTIASVRPMSILWLFELMLNLGNVTKRCLSQDTISSLKPLILNLLNLLTNMISLSSTKSSDVDFLPPLPTSIDIMEGLISMSVDFDHGSRVTRSVIKPGLSAQDVSMRLSSSNSVSEILCQYSATILLAFLTQPSFNNLSFILLSRIYQHTSLLTHIVDLLTTSNGMASCSTSRYLLLLSLHELILMSIKVCVTKASGQNVPIDLHCAISDPLIADTLHTACVSFITKIPRQLRDWSLLVQPSEIQSQDRRTLKVVSKIILLSHITHQIRKFDFRGDYKNVGCVDTLTHASDRALVILWRAFQDARFLEDTVPAPSIGLFMSSASELTQRSAYISRWMLLLYALPCVDLEVDGLATRLSEQVKTASKDSVEVRCRFLCALQVLYLRAVQREPLWNLVTSELAAILSDNFSKSAPLDPLLVFSVLKLLDTVSLGRPSLPYLHTFLPSLTLDHEAHTPPTAESLAEQNVVSFKPLLVSLYEKCDKITAAQGEQRIAESLEQRLETHTQLVLNYDLTHCVSAKINRHTILLKSVITSTDSKSPRHLMRLIETLCLAHIERSILTSATIDTEDLERNVESELSVLFDSLRDWARPIDVNRLTT